jgi:excisionase family DNA binding protein
MRDSWVTLNQASILTGVSRYHLRAAISAGELSAMKIGKLTLLRADELEQLGALTQESAPVAVSA